jgi:hypothetical protein
MTLVGFLDHNILVIIDKIDIIACATFKRIGTISKLTI